MGAPKLLTTDSGPFACQERTATVRTKTHGENSAPAWESVSPVPQKVLDTPNLILFPGLTKPPGTRVQKFHVHLHAAKFKTFFRPVSLSQVATAMEFLDAHYGRWDGDEDLAVWEYLLPAIHKFFPEHRLNGFTAAFGPPKPASAGWSIPLWLTISMLVMLIGIGVLWCVIDR